MWVEAQRKELWMTSMSSARGARGRWRGSRAAGQASGSRSWSARCSPTGALRRGNGGRDRRRRRRHSTLTPRSPKPVKSRRDAPRRLQRLRTKPGPWSGDARRCRRKSAASPCSFDTARAVRKIWSLVDDWRRVPVPGRSIFQLNVLCSDAWAGSLCEAGAVGPAEARPLGQRCVKAGEGKAGSDQRANAARGRREGVGFSKLPL